jgi:hypothetical protein
MRTEVGSQRTDVGKTLNYEDSFRLLISDIRLLFSEPKTINKKL